MWGSVADSTPHRAFSLALRQSPICWWVEGQRMLKYKHECGTELLTFRTVGTWSNHNCQHMECLKIPAENVFWCSVPPPRGSALPLKEPPPSKGLPVSLVTLELRCRPSCCTSLCTSLMHIYTVKIVWAHCQNIEAGFWDIFCLCNSYQPFVSKFSLHSLLMMIWEAVYYRVLDS